MIFKFKEEEIESAIEKIRQFVDEREGEFVIEIAKNRSQRSLSQNSFWWIICTLVGTEMGITKEAAHKLLCLENNAEVIKFPNGNIKLIPRETKVLTTTEMAQLITKAMVWAQQELNLNIKTPDEYKQEELMRIRNEYSKMFY